MLQNLNNFTLGSMYDTRSFGTAFSSLVVGILVIEFKYQVWIAIELEFCLLTVLVLREFG